MSPVFEQRRLNFWCEHLCVFICTSNNHVIFLDSGLLKEGVQFPQVFLLSNFELQHHDFHRLHESLERELPEHKKDALRFSFLKMNLEIIEKKKDEFKSKVSTYAYMSAAGAAVPVPGISFVADTGLLARFTQQCKIGFGLDRPSLQRLSESIGVPLEDLTSVVRSPLSLNEINSESISKTLSQTASFARSVIEEEALRLVPFAQSQKAYNKTEKVMLDFLDKLAEDAQNVFEMALSAPRTPQCEA